MAASPSHSAADLAHPKYRPDIDGLRAIAVLSVVLFHGYPELLHGGFVGVDIFFVISGYLISTILFTNLQQDRFSFVTFYVRRIKRIFPALVVVLLACYAIGWNVLFTSEYKALNKHIVGGAGFISNLVLWSESGYFDTAAEIKPLLHLWSLAIEEQFYLLWPLLVWLAWKRRLGVLGLTIAIAIASFVANLLLVRTDPVSAFYFPHTRFWELMIGSILACLTLFHSHRIVPASAAAANLRSGLGVGLIAVSIFIIDRQRAFPGWWALLPTLGAALAISAGPTAWLNRRLLSQPILVWIGLISYPLYLWHWPLLSLARVLEGDTPPLMVRTTAVLIAVLAAWLTYKLLEQPVRTSRRHMAVASGLLASMALLAVIGLQSFLIERQHGLPRAFLQLNPLDGTGFSGADQGFAQASCSINDFAARRLFGSCSADSRGNVKYALWGDSKAAALYPGLIRTSTPEGRWMFIGGNGPGGTAVPVLSSRPIFSTYRQLTTIALNELAGNADIESVVIVTATRALFQLRTTDSISDLPQSTLYEAAFEGLAATVRQLLDAGKKVVLVVDNPTLPDPTMCMRRITRWDWVNRLFHSGSRAECGLPLPRHLEYSAQYRRLLEQLRQLDSERVFVFDTVPRLCDDGRCAPSREGRLLYSYTDHISDYAAGLIGKDLNAFLAAR